MIIESFLIEKKQDKGVLNLKFRAARWQRRKENNVQYSFLNGAVVFEPNSFIRYEILDGQKWVSYDIRRQPFLDISGYPEPVNVRFRTFKDTCYSKYKYLILLHGGNPFFIGIQQPFVIDPENLQDEATTEDMIHEYGGQIAI